MDTYEKKYNEALNDAFYWMKEKPEYKELLQSIFPELKENDDEKIRKEIVDYFTQYKESGIRGVDIIPWIDYLEKQKEHRSAEWSEEDETYLQDALWCVEEAKKSCKDENDMGACWSARRWLNSLRGKFVKEGEK